MACGRIKWHNVPYYSNKHNDGDSDGSNWWWSNNNNFYYWMNRYWDGVGYCELYQFGLKLYDSVSFGELMVVKVLIESMNFWTGDIVGVMIGDRSDVSAHTCLKWFYVC